MSFTVIPWSFTYTQLHMANAQGETKVGHSPYTYRVICAWQMPKFGHWRPNAQGEAGF